VEPGSARSAPERLQLAREYGAVTIDVTDARGSVPDTVRQLTGGRGPDSVIDAVGMEAHGAPVAQFGQMLVSMLPKPLSTKLTEKAAIDRLSVLYAAIDTVCRGGTISLSGVYGGAVDPLPMLELFDKQIQLRMGQANVKTWIDDVLPLVSRDDDPLGVESLATHHLPLEQAPQAYQNFQRKADGAIKVLLQP